MDHVAHIRNQSLIAQLNLARDAHIMTASIGISLKDILTVTTIEHIKTHQRVVRVRVVGAVGILTVSVVLRLVDRSVQ